MRRAVLTTSILAGGLLLASVAAARPGVDLFAAERDETPRVERTAGQDGLLRLWSTVGRCVVQRDRNAAMTFVRAPLGSDLSLAAARRLDPVFAGCLAGSRVPGPSSVVLRRAALADALGIAKARI